MARFAAKRVLHPVIRKLITQVGFTVSVWVYLIPTPALVTPRQRQKRRIDSKVPNSDFPQIVNQRTVPAKMRKEWIHQTIQEATPRPTHVEETSGTEEEHMDVDHGISILFIHSLHQCSLHARLGHHASTTRTPALQVKENKENISSCTLRIRFFAIYPLF